MQKIIDFLKSVFEQEYKEPILGVLDEETPSDTVVQFEDVVAKSAPAIWIEKKDSDIIKLPYLWQATSSSCVAHTLALMYTILFMIKHNVITKFSAAWFYRSRINKNIGDGEGMYFGDIEKMGATIGAMPYDLMPSDGLTDKQIDAIKTSWFHEKIAGIFTLNTKWVNLPFDFDTVAATQQITKKGIMIWFKFGPGEYFGKAIPQVLGTDVRYAHSVTVIDSGVFNGKEYLIIQCSADKNQSIKKISRSFYTRAYLNRYPMNFKYEIGGDKPVYDRTIVSAQRCLKYEGLFPSNVDFAERVGPTTQDALKKFQEKYSLPVTKTIDRVTEKKLEELYS